MQAIRRIFAAPVFEDESKTHQSYLLNFITLMYLLVILLAIPSALFGAGVEITSALIPLLAIRILPLFIPTVLGQVLLRFRYIRVGSITFSVGLWLSYMFLTIVQGGIQSTTYPSFMLIILLFGLLIGNRPAVGVTFVSILFGGVVAVMGTRGALPEPISETSAMLNWITYSFVFIMIGGLMYLFLRNQEEAFNRVELANAELTKAGELLEQRVADATRDLSLAAEIGHRISLVQDPKEILVGAVNLITERFDLYYAQIYVTDPTGRKLELRAGTGDVGRTLLQRGHHLAVDLSSINGIAATERRPVIVKDTATSSIHRPNPLLPLTRSEMAVPMIANERIVGVIDLQSAQPEALSEENLAAFEALAGQLAIALVNAELFAEAERARENVALQAKRLTQAGWEDFLDAIHVKERISFAYQNGELLEEEADSVSKNSDSTHMVTPIQVLNAPIGRFSFEGVERLTQDQHELVMTISQQVAQRLENIRLLAEAERYRQEASQTLQRLTRESWQEFQKSKDRWESGYVYANNRVNSLKREQTVKPSQLRQPLLVHGEPIGSLELALPKDGMELDAESSELIGAVATALSEHVESLRLAQTTEIALQETQLRTNELAILNEMSQALTAETTSDGVVKTVYEYLSRMMDTTDFYLVFYEEEQDEVVFALTASGEKMRWYAERRKAGHGITEYIIRQRQHLWMPDNVEERLKELGITGYGKEAQSWLGAPMILGGRVLGVIGLQSYTTPRLYTEQHLNMLTAVANQAAIAIENTRLFEWTQKRAERETLINTINQRIQSATSVESALETAARELGQLLKARRTVAEINAAVQNGQ